MHQGIYIIKENRNIAKDMFLMRLYGDTSSIKPGQFINIAIDGLYLRRPISVCDVEGDIITIIFKVVGKGTEKLSGFEIGKELDILTQLGNGYDLSLSGDRPLLIGGGAGVPPMYYLAKKLIEQGKKPSVVMGFNKADEIYFKEEFERLGMEVYISTADGSVGVKGFVTDAMPGEYSYVYVCGPEPMLKAVYNKAKTSGEFSFEERMGCGFGACMGCSCKTKYGNKRICKDGPVLKKEEIIW